MVVILPSLIEYPYRFYLWGIDGQVLAGSITFFYLFRLYLIFSSFLSSFLNRLNHNKFTYMRLVQERPLILFRNDLWTTWIFPFAVSFSRLPIEIDSLFPGGMIFCCQSKKADCRHLYRYVIYRWEGSIAAAYWKQSDWPWLKMARSFEALTERYSCEVGVSELLRCYLLSTGSMFTSLS